MKNKIKETKETQDAAQHGEPVDGVYFVRRKDGLFTALPNFWAALEELRNHPEKTIVDRVTGYPIVRMGALLCHDSTPPLTPLEKLMEQEIEQVGVAVVRSVSRKAYREIRQDAEGGAFPLSFAVTVDLTERKIDSKFTGSIRMKYSGTAKLADPNQPELKLFDAAEVERVAQEIERNSKDA